MLQREGLAVDGSWRVNVNSTRCCAFCMELGIKNSRKSRDGSLSCIRVALPPRVDGVGVADARVGGDTPVGMNADL